MKTTVTNKYGLPQEVVNAILKDRYTADDDEEYDYSVTTIVAPIQQTILARKNKNNLVVRDVTDFFWSFLGSIAHQVLEEGWHQSLNSIVEKRLYIDVLGLRISGKFDCYGNEEIRDYKSTKVYKVTKGDYEDWEKQLNVYAYFCEENGYPVKAIRIIALLFDWKEHEGYKKDYPPAPIQVIKIPFWRKERQRKYIESRVKKLLRASEMDDLTLAHTYPCSKKEMWQNVKNVSIKKKGNKVATRSFKTEKEAQAVFNESYKEKKGYEVITNYSPRKRCFKFCPVANHCPQHKQLCIEEGVLPEEKEEPTIF